MSKRNQTLIMEEFLYGTGEGRTLDSLIKGQLLYQLSYCPIRYSDSLFLNNTLVIHFPCDTNIEKISLLVNSKSALH